MNTGSFKLVLTWNVVLTVLLLATLAFAAVSAQASNDPPAQIFSAHLDHAASGRGGVAYKAVISSTGYQNFIDVPVNFTGQNHLHQCVAIGSANVENPSKGTTGNMYLFNVGVDIQIGSYSTMTLELSDNAGVNDPNYWPVTTNKIFYNLSAAPHTFHFMAAKAVGAPNLTIYDATLTVICFQQIQFAASQEPAAPKDLQLTPADDK